MAPPSSDTSPVVTETPVASHSDIAALEKLFEAKLGTLRWQATAALLGGQALAGLLAAWVAAPKQTEALLLALLPFL